jgi:hypothetical protein
MKNNDIFTQKKSGSELWSVPDSRSILRISLPSFLFESTVETASNRMIYVRGLIKVLKRNSTFYLFKVIAKV